MMIPWNWPCLSIQINGWLCRDCLRRKWLTMASSVKGGCWLAVGFHYHILFDHSTPWCNTQAKGIFTEFVAQFHLKIIYWSIDPLEYLQCLSPLCETCLFSHLFNVQLTCWIMKVNRFEEASCRISVHIPTGLSSFPVLQGKARCFHCGLTALEVFYDPKAWQCHPLNVCRGRCQRSYSLPHKTCI